MTETTKRKRHLTAQIKPATKHALMAWLAEAGNRIEELTLDLACHEDAIGDLRARNDGLVARHRWMVRLAVMLAVAFVVAVYQAATA